MSDTATEWPATGTENGAKEARTVRMKLGNGPEWSIPVDVIKTLLTSAWDANGEFMGSHLQYALTGRMPKATRTHRNRAGE